MTKAEAMKLIGLKETDTIDKDGVRSLLRVAEERITTWSLSSGMKADLEKSIAAYKALLED